MSMEFESSPGYEAYKLERKEKIQRLLESDSMSDKLQGLLELFRDVAMETTDPLVREVANKFIEKYSFKQQLESMEEDADDTDIYQEIKKLGIFLVHHRRMGQSFRGENDDFALDDGDEVLDLHLPPVSEDKKKNLRSSAVDSFRMIAEYIQKHNLHPKYITGITYEALAHLAPHFGFVVEKITIPEELCEAVERVYKQTDRAEKGLPIGDISYIYQDRDAFLERFPSK
ncbi:MAG: hypothetical protein WCO23_02435 [bacterium]